MFCNLNIYKKDTTMKNIEVLKLVKRNNQNNYRAVLDKTLVSDIKDYSWWGNSSLLYDLFWALIKSENLNLLRPGSNNDIKEVSCNLNKAQIIDENKISIKARFRQKFSLEMPLSDFFIFYDEYNKLIRNEAHEIILKKEDDKITTEGVWYQDDSPFNKKPLRKIFKIKRISKFYWDKMYDNECLDLITDEDEYPCNLGYIYESFLEFFPVLCIDGVYHDYRGREVEYYQAIKNNLDKLIGEEILNANYMIFEIESSDTLNLKACGFKFDEEDTLLCQVDLDQYFKAYFGYKDLGKQNADEILFVEENGQFRLEGIWYSNKDKINVL